MLFICYSIFDILFDMLMLFDMLCNVFDILMLFDANYSVNAFDELWSKENSASVCERSW